MAWTTPKTWTDGSVLTAAELNQQVRDNLNFLFAKPVKLYNVNEAANYTTSSTGFIAVDNTNLVLTITTGGGDVLIGFAGSCYSSSNIFEWYFDVTLDGSRLGGDDGILVTSGTGAQPFNSSFSYLKTGLSAGVHQFKLQWKTQGGTLTMYAGAGTASYDVHPQFFVKEL